MTLVLSVIKYILFQNYFEELRLLLKTIVIIAVKIDESIFLKEKMIMEEKK